MQDRLEDRDAEIARLQKVAERLARRTNTCIVTNPEKLANFAIQSASAQAVHERESV